ncbi:MAG: hypothetical protein U0229_25190 [Anaeromyxobacter sp.]
MTVARMVALAAAAALLAACPRAQDPDAGRGTRLAPPAGLALTFVPPAELWLTFSHPGGADRYELEQREGGGAWHPADAYAQGTEVFRVTLDVTLPERTLLTFRVRALMSGAASAWSELAWRVPLKQPEQFYARYPLGDANLVWNLGNSVARAVRLERAEPDVLSGVVASWVDLPVAPGAMEYVDVTVKERVRYRYRLRAVDGVDESPTVELDVTPLVKPPVGLTATRVAGGTALSWTNRSEHATQVIVHSVIGQRYVVLPAGATSWLDPIDPPWPLERWFVEANDPEYPGAWSLSAGAGLPEVAAGGLVGRAAPVPFAYAVARGGDGTFAWSTEQGPSFALELRRSAPGAAARPLAGFAVRPGIAFDAASHPHAIDVSAVVAHVWHDGASWQAEEIEPTPPSVRLAMAVGPGGEVEVLHVEYSHAVQRYVAQLRARTPTGWETANVPVPAGLDPALEGPFALGPGGAAYVAAVPAAPYTGPCAVLVRGSAGWTGETIPGTAGTGAAVVRLTPFEGGVAVLVRKGNAIELWRWAGGAWAAPEAVFEGATMFRDPFLVVSGDGARTAVVGEVAGPSSYTDRLSVFEPVPGGWEETVLARCPPGRQEHLTGAGLLGDGRLWVLGAPPDDSAADDGMPWALWEEPRP